MKKWIFAVVGLVVGGAIVWFVRPYLGKSDGGAA